jgi:predicted nucleic acid-binding protein
VSRFLLDTNIISNVTEPAPSPALIVWIVTQAEGSLLIAAPTVAEIWRRIIAMP